MRAACRGGTSVSMQAKWPTGDNRHVFRRHRQLWRLPLIRSAVGWPPVRRRRASAQTASAPFGRIYGCAAVAANSCDCIG